jgi:SepF-like predicted cell division protein (DUF552 family)
MPSFGLFRKQKKQADQESPVEPVQEPEKTEVPSDAPMEEPKSETTENMLNTEAPPAQSSKTYLKAMPLRELSDLDNIKNEVQNGNILILRITPLASKSIDDVKAAVNELYAFTESIGGDIARLGEERIVICPKNIRIWREKKPVPNEPLPTAA